MLTRQQKQHQRHQQQQHHQHQVQGGAGGLGAAVPEAGAANAHLAHLHGNAQARHAILHGIPGHSPPALRMLQALQAITPAVIGPGAVINVPLRNVGLITRLIVKISATVTAGATTTQTLTNLGPANFLSNVIFNDYSGIQRINTAGWHLPFLSTVKQRERRVWGAAYTTDTPLGIQNNNAAAASVTPANASGNIAPATIAANAARTVQIFYEIPFAVSSVNLEGSLYAEITQASANVLMTLNPNMFVTSAQDSTLAFYRSGGVDLATLSNVVFTIYQEYYEQLPKIGGKTVLPHRDLSTAYLLNNTASGLVVQNQNNALSFVNQRKFLSIFTIFDNNGTLNFGTDITTISLVSANMTPLFLLDPNTFMMLNHRDLIGDDMPPGMYYSSFRDRPIDTDAYGNMQYIIIPSSVLGSGSVFLYAVEALGVLGAVNQGPALPSGGG